MQSESRDPFGSNVALFDGILCLRSLSAMKRRLERRWITSDIPEHFSLDQYSSCNGRL